MKLRVKYCYCRVKTSLGHIKNVITRNAAMRRNQVFNASTKY